MINGRFARFVLFFLIKGMSKSFGRNLHFTKTILTRKGSVMGLMERTVPATTTWFVWHVSKRRGQDFSRCREELLRTKGRLGKRRRHGPPGALISALSAMLLTIFFLVVIRLMHGLTKVA